MKHITSTALAAGAQDAIAIAGAAPLAGMGSISQQPMFRPILRRDIMTAINTCGRDLGLRQAAVVVLDALLSCLPCKGPDGREAPVSPATLLTIYASNDTLCFRAKGLTDRQLRRHIDTLERAGLLLRRDSANGKRFPVMKGGKAVGAFGLDLSPLFARADAILALANRHRQEADELRGLRAQILHLRAACLDLRLDAARAAFVDSLRNLVRRASLTLIEARTALAHLTTVICGEGPAAPTVTTDAVPLPPPMPTDAAMAEAQGALPPEHEPAAAPIPAPDMSMHQVPPSNKTPASDGRNVRHIEPKSDTKKTNPGITKPRWSDLPQLSAFYTEPRTTQDGTRIAYEFGKVLRVSQDLLAKAITGLGLWELLRIQDRIAAQIDSILNPEAYLRSILHRDRAENVVSP